MQALLYGFVSTHTHLLHVEIIWIFLTCNKLKYSTFKKTPSHCHFYFLSMLYWMLRMSTLAEAKMQSPMLKWWKQPAPSLEDAQKNSKHLKSRVDLNTALCLKWMLQPFNYRMKLKNHLLVFWWCAWAVAVGDTKFHKQVQDHDFHGDTTPQLSPYYFLAKTVFFVDPLLVIKSFYTSSWKSKSWLKAVRCTTAWMLKNRCSESQLWT